MSHSRGSSGGTVSSLARAYGRRLAEAGVAAPRVDAELLLAHVLDVPRGRLRVADPPDEAQLARLAELVERRAGREPLQHLTGTAAFRNLELAVGPGVFVPRPETELVAGWAVEALVAAHALGGAEPVAVDLGTGSGAIAAALATEVPQAHVHAVELSPDAYGYAECNLAGTGVDLRLGDLAAAFPDLDGVVDVAVANPPYIPLDAYVGVDRESREHEPALALWSGADGLEAVRAVERAAGRLVRPGGVLGCEHADAQGESAPAVFAATGNWELVRDHRDLNDRPRFVTARRVSATGARAGGTMGP